MATKKVRVACIQTINEKNKTTQENLDLVVPFIEIAAKKGAKLILLPELMPNEYIFSTEIWNFGETLLNGSTLKFLSQQSQKNHVYIGLSFLEVEGLHFYNTFIMTDVNGKLITRIRKNPGALEAFYFNGYNNKHMLKTIDFGNIFVGICYENYLAPLENELMFYENCKDCNNKISLILQPHSCPFAKPEPNSFNADIICTINDTVDKIASQYAKKFNIPVLFCNKVGILRSKILNDTCMAGWTKIVNYDGSVVAKSENCGENTKPIYEVIIGDIDIAIVDNNTYGNDIGNEEQFEYISDGWNRWNKTIYHTYKVAEFVGYIYYTMSIKRRIKASRISGCSWFASYGLHIVWLSTTLYILRSLG